MQGNMAEGHAVDGLQRPQTLVGALLPEAHLDGEDDLRPALHLGEEFLQLVGVLQEAAAASGMHLEGKGAAHVDVDAPPALRLEGVAEARQFVAVAGNDLRHRGDAAVGFGVRIAQVLAPHLPFLNPHEGRIVLPHPAGALPMRPPVRRIRIPLQRRKSNV